VSAIRATSLLFLALLVSLAMPIEASPARIQWDYASVVGEPLTGFRLEACMIDDEGQCAMQAVQQIPPRQQQAKVQVPGRGRVRCFQVLAVTATGQSDASNRLCLTN
jgi:hypothetical protein